MAIDVLGTLQSAFKDIITLTPALQKDLATKQELLGQMAPVTSMPNGDTVGSLMQEGLAALTTQNNVRQFAEVAGMLTPEQSMIALDKSYTVASEKARASEAEYAKLSSTNIFDNPVDWFFAQFQLEGAKSAAIADRAVAQGLQQDMLNKNQSVQQFAATQKLLTQNLTQEVVNGKVDAAKNLIANAEIARQINNLTANTDRINTLLKLDEQQVEFALKYENILRGRAADARAEEGMNLERQRLDRQLKNEQEDSDALANLLAQYNTGAQAMGKPLAKTGAELKLLNQMNPEDTQAIIHFAGSQGSLGNTAGEAAVTATKLGYSAPQGTRAYEIDQGMQDFIRTNNLPLDAKNLGQTSQLATQAITAADAQYQDKVKVVNNAYDPTNYRRPLPITRLAASPVQDSQGNMVVGSPIIKNSKLLSAALKLAQDRKQEDITLTELMTLGKDMVRTGAISQTQAIQDITNYYGLNKMLVNEDGGFVKRGLPPVKTWNIEYVAPVPNPIDIAQRVREENPYTFTTAVGQFDLATSYLGSIKNAYAGGEKVYIDPTNLQQVGAALMDKPIPNPNKVKSTPATGAAPFTGMNPASPYAPKQ